MVTLLQTRTSYRALGPGRIALSIHIRRSGRLLEGLSTRGTDTWRTNRTEHRDAWRVGFEELKKKEYNTMDREEWNAWHSRHAVKSRLLPQTDNKDSLVWKVPEHIVKGNTYLPLGSIDNISRSSSISSTIAKMCDLRERSFSQNGGGGHEARPVIQIITPFRGRPGTGGSNAGLSTRPGTGSHSNAGNAGKNSVTTRTSLQSL